MTEEATATIRLPKTAYGVTAAIGRAEDKLQDFDTLISKVEARKTHIEARLEKLREAQTSFSPDELESSKQQAFMSAKERFSKMCEQFGYSADTEFVFEDDPADDDDE